MKLSECAHIIAGKLIGNDAEFERICVYPLCNKIEPKTLVIPVLDEENNLQFLNKLPASSAVGLLVAENHMPAELPKISYILVKHRSTALAHLAAVWRAQFSIPVIAVTGSCGKTTTTALINHLLQQRYRILPNPYASQTYNTIFSLPWIVLGLAKEHEATALELATIGPGQITFLTQIVQPQIAIITMVGPVFSNGLENLTAIAKEKGAIYIGLSPNGVAIINADDAFANLWQNSIGNRSSVTFGIHHPADVMAKAIRQNSLGFPIFDLHFGGELIPIQLNLLGNFNIYNALAAATAALIMGLSLAEIKQGLETFQPLSSRFVRFIAPNGAIIIDDTCQALVPDCEEACKWLGQQEGNTILALSNLDGMGITFPPLPFEIQLHEYIGSFAKKEGVKSLYAFGSLASYTAGAFGVGGNAYSLSQKDQFVTLLKKEIIKSLPFPTFLLLKGDLDIPF